MQIKMLNTEVLPKKNEKWRKLTALVGGVGVCAELNRRSGSSAASLVISGAKKRGCSIERATADYLISFVGGDLQTVLNELEKLCSFTGNGEITADIIENVAIKSLDASVFDLANSIISKEADRAFQILSTLLTQKTEPTLILGTLASAFVDIYRAKIAHKEERRLFELSHFSAYQGKAFKLDSAARLARRLSENQARLCIDFLSEADIGIKFSNKPNRLILEELTVKLLNV